MPPQHFLGDNVMSSRPTFLPMAAAIAALLLASAFAMAGDPPDHPMRFESLGNGGNCGGCEWVSAMGTITPETPMAFERFLARHGSFVPTMFFHSDGGDIRAALTLGMMIREHGIDTAVGETFEGRDLDDRWHGIHPGRCLSACAYALMGGKRRFVDENEVGVHQMYDPRAILMPDRATLSAADASRQQALLGRMVAYAQYMGIDPFVLTLASDTPPTEIMMLDEETLVELGIDNMVSRVSGWSIEPYRDGIVARIETQDGIEAPRHLTFFCRSDGPHILFSRRLDGIDPDAFIKAIRWIQVYLDDQPIRHGRDPFDWRAWSRDGSLYVSLPLDGGEWSRIRLSDAMLKISIDLPHVFNWEDGASVPLAGAGPFLDAARRNCLRGDM
jgi:hypothetical protein